MIEPGTPESGDEDEYIPGATIREVVQEEKKEEVKEEKKEEVKEEKKEEEPKPAAPMNLIMAAVPKPPAEK